MKTFDFIARFLVSNIVQKAVIGNDTWLLGRDGQCRDTRRDERGSRAHRNKSDSGTPLRGTTTGIDGGSIIDSKLRRLDLRGMVAPGIPSAVLQPNSRARPVTARCR